MKSLADLKRRIEKLEVANGLGEARRFEIDLGEGKIIYATQAEIHAVMQEINGADTGIGPSGSRRAAVKFDLNQEFGVAD
jgi:hypothetical protein